MNYPKGIKDSFGKHIIYHSERRREILPLSSEKICICNLNLRNYKMTFEEFEEQLKNVTDKKALKISPRYILNAFGYERRTKFNVISIKQYFVNNELEINPDFLSVHIDWTVEIKKKQRVRIKKEEKEVVDYDPVSRVQLLDSASRIPISVNKGAELREAITQMMLNNFSQLPVMKNEFTLEGLISWEIIGNKLFHVFIILFYTVNE